MPKKPSIAGSSVIAEATEKTTVIAAPMPRPFRKLTRSTSRPSSATQTVAPANSTARPEVSSARTAESSTVMPVFSPPRCLVTMKSA